MTEHLAATRSSYDNVADAYHELVKDRMAGNPLERAMLTAFAELTGDPIVDLGCGAGRTTGFLKAIGCDISGIDLSPKMIELARKNYPGVTFEVGSMTELSFKDGELGGVLAWYSTFHIPRAELPGLFTEFARVLRPGGRVLIGTHSGQDETLQPEKAYGMPVSYTAYLYRPEVMVEALAEAGLVVTAQLTEPGSTPGRGYAAFFAQKS
ncbi:SAM-dependent methyltransferase [Kribbella sp. ALI-6-A]|uniref:class I SAM-dependent methyltransferase n=1 Tax=Kribbella sp. ALI-6-A TaxID=1933817 RepID=UPI00097BD852|nr:class I SAM-dependent methyltransferase [Kribbella sp. ALI-6-A]ONI69250.1 SAM-dependent methyltransferase [Kribbella sp. ALI-6-A]